MDGKDFGVVVFISILTIAMLVGYATLDFSGAAKAVAIVEANPSDPADIPHQASELEKTSKPAEDHPAAPSNERSH